MKKRENILSFDEIVRIVGLMSGLGIAKVRITGGEPLVRRDIERLVGMLSGISGIKELTMTTNATLLPSYARALAENGLKRVNISLDTLRPGLFSKITGGGELSKVLDGITAAIKEGLTPVRLNTVIMRGINEDDLAGIIDFAAASNITVCFIECMPMSPAFDWKTCYMPITEVLERRDIMERVDTSSVKGLRSSPAYFLPLKSGRGEIGFISPMSERFCDRCNRLRLTADGKLRSCLPAENDIGLKSALANGASDDDLIRLINKAVMIKPEIGVYDFTENNGRAMIQIGG